jgi:hypothetical protein
MSAATPAEAAAARGVTEIVHFTTDKGVLGSIRKDALLSRQRVQSDPDLAYIFTEVWPRRDPEWIDHVSFSVTRINRELYFKAARNLPGLWWGILSFGIDMLDHLGVVFTTTNNVYEEACERGEGVAGFEAMFKPRVRWGYYDSVNVRASCRPANLPTDPQAEVLYPGRAHLEHLRAVYVPEEQHRRLVLAWCDVMAHDELPVDVCPNLFM